MRKEPGINETVNKKNIRTYVIWTHYRCVKRNKIIEEATSNQINERNAAKAWKFNVDEESTTTNEWSIEQKEKRF